MRKLFFFLYHLDTMLKKREKKSFLDCLCFYHGSEGLTQLRFLTTRCQDLLSNSAPPPHPSPTPEGETCE